MVVTSGELGHAKPAQEIFHAALRELGADPDHAWHVGDSLTSDVAGAHNAGLGAAVWLDRVGVNAHMGTTAFHRIESLTDLVTAMS